VSDALVGMAMPARYRATLGAGDVGAVLIAALP
jgi:hypothetical protein